MGAIPKIVQLLGTKCDEYTLPAGGWRCAQRGKSICPKCFKLLPTMYPRPLDVVLLQIANRGRTSCCGVFQAGVGIIHVRLLEILEQFMEGFVFGACSMQDGAPRQDYRSFYCRQHVIMRDCDPDGSYWVCPVCGVVGCSMLSPYVVATELPGGGVIADRIHRLYLRADLAQTLPWARFPDIRPYEIPIRTEPYNWDTYPAGAPPEAE